MSSAARDVRRKRERATSPRPDLPGPRRRSRPSSESLLTLQDLRDKPAMLVGVADLVGIGVVPSYMALRRQRLAGVFPEPKTLPSRLLAWEARQIVNWYDSLNGRRA